MKQKRIILDNQTPENSASKLPHSITFYVNTINRDKLAYKDGSIPFLITTRILGGSVPEDFIDIFVKARRETYARITKKSLLNTYFIYRIPDYGNQSLSAGISDFSLQCFDNDGYKIPETKIATIRNYTTKEAFLLIKKETLNDDSKIHIIVDFKRSSKITREKIKLTRDTNGAIYKDKFHFNMNFISEDGTIDTRIDSLHTLDFIVEDNGIEYTLNNSEYMFNIEGVDFVSKDGSEFVSKQGTYFDFVQNNYGNWNKTFHNVEVVLNDNLKHIDTLYIRDRKNDSNYHFNDYNFLKDIPFRRLSNLSVYKFNPDTERGIKLINGHDFYLDTNKKLIIPGSINVDGEANNDIYEIYVRPLNTDTINFKLQNIEGNSFNIKNALYENKFVKWNPDIDNSIITIFEDGKYIYGIHSESFSVSEPVTVEYIIEDIEWNDNPDAEGEPIALTDAAEIVFSGLTFNNFNKYQITTDPYFNTFGEDHFLIENELALQEVYLYDRSLNFQLDNDEPFVDNSSSASDTNITIQEIDDIYTNDNYKDSLSSILDIIKTNYKDFQDEKKLSGELILNAKVQSLETQISKLKRNYKAILENSNINYTTYTGLTGVIQFLFLAISGTNEDNFDIIYRDKSNRIIKKEYNCTIVNGLYVSIPFFSDSLGNSYGGIKFEIQRNNSNLQYYIFK